MPASPQFSHLPFLRVPIVAFLFLQGTPHLSYMTSACPSVAGVLAASLGSADLQSVPPPVLRKWPCQALLASGQTPGSRLEFLQKLPASHSLRHLHSSPCHLTTSHQRDGNRVLPGLLSRSYIPLPFSSQSTLSKTDTRSSHLSHLATSQASSH